LVERQRRARDFERINDLIVIARGGVLEMSDFNFQTMRPGYQTGDNDIVVLGNEPIIVSIEDHWLAAVNGVGGNTKVWSDLAYPSNACPGKINNRIGTINIK
jgi:hypothetical protein